LTARRAIGLFGGTFDPVHHGHLRVALDALEGLDLAEVRLLPCRQPPHRPPPHASASQRRRLLESAVAGEPRLHVDARELERPGPSYTVDTLAALRAELGPVQPLVLLVGGDAFHGLPSWHRWREFIDLAHIAVLQRPGHGTDLPLELEQLVAQRRTSQPEDLQHAAAGRVLFWRVTQLEISASHIRALVAAGRSIRYLVPAAVLDEITRQGLYRDRETA
jgi:nicotinate-nucleotide adenylyltransferase